jgi:hypothetical protein
MRHTNVRVGEHRLSASEPAPLSVSLKSLGFPFPIAFGILLGRERQEWRRICRIDSIPIGALPRPSELGSARFRLSLVP